MKSLFKANWLASFFTLIVFITPLALRAEDYSPPNDLGVFPIIRSSNVQGTAFLIDKKYGWLLSAAHVLARCTTTSPTQVVNMIVTSHILVGNTEFSISNMVPVCPIAWGYDFTKDSPYEGTTSDWVLLQIVNLDDLQRFNLFDEFKIEPAINRVILQQLAKENRDGTLFVAGFPNHVTRAKRFPCNFVEEDELGNGLWQVSAQVVDGNSGGPCYNQDELVGIVLAAGQGTTLIGAPVPNSMTCDVNPIYAVLPKVASQIPYTKSIQQCTNFFQGNTTNLESELLALYEIIPTLNSIEKWQLFYLVCQGTRSARLDFVYRYFCKYIDKNRWMIDSMAQTNQLSAAEMSAMLHEYDRIVTEAQTGGFTNINPSIGVAGIVGDMILKNYENLNKTINEAGLVAKSTASAVYLHSKLNGLPDTELSDIVALAWANQRVTNSVQVPVAYLVADKELNEVQRINLAEYTVLLGTHESLTSHRTASLDLANKIAQGAVGDAAAASYSQMATRAANSGKIVEEIEKHPAIQVINTINAKYFK